MQKCLSFDIQKICGTIMEKIYQPKNKDFDRNEIKLTL